MLPYSLRMSCFSYQAEIDAYRSRKCDILCELDSSAAMSEVHW